MRTSKTSILIPRCSPNGRSLCRGTVATHLALRPLRTGAKHRRVLRTDAQTPPNVLRISVGRGGNGRTEGEEAATQFCVGLSRVRATWSLSNQLEQAGDR